MAVARSLQDIRLGRYPYGTRAGVFTNPVSVGTAQYENQINTKILPMLQARSDAMQRAYGPMFGPGAGGGFNPWGSNPWTSPASVVQPQVQGGQPINPHSTISNVKNPQIKSILDKILGNVDQAAGNDLNQNPYMLRTNTLDAGQEGRVQDAASSLPGMQAAQQKSLADFTKQYLEGINEGRGYQQQEAGAIGEFYDKGPEGVQARLDQLAKQRELAVAGAVDRALDRVRGQTNMQRLNLGDSSYLDSQAMNTAAELMGREAVNQSDLQRQNYLTVKDSQAALADRRRANLDALNRMGLLPIQAQSALTSSNLGQLGQAGDLIRANNIYRTETPEDVLARRLGLLGGASNIDLANTFYGLNKPYEPDFSGYAINPGFGGRTPNYGGGNPYGYADLGYASAPRQQTLTQQIQAARLANPQLTAPNYRSPVLSMPTGLSNAVAPQHSPAEQAYFDTTGIYPNDDPFFSDYLFNNLWNENNP